MITVLYPGSFDPFHLGHLDVIEQSVALFGEVVVGVMHNPTKPSGMFTLDERVEMIRSSIAYMPSVKVVAFAGLAVDAAREVAAAFIVKGLRTGWRLRGRAADGAHQPRRQRRANRVSALQAGIGVDQQPLHPRDRPLRRRRFGPRPTACCGPIVSGASTRRGVLRPILTAEMTYDDKHDEFEDDEEFDDSDAFVRSTNGYVGDAEALLAASDRHHRLRARRCRCRRRRASTATRSSNCSRNRCTACPSEMRQARWMIKERQEFVSKTRREADELLEAARVQAERMVQRTEVVRAAEQRARQISEAADADSRRLRHETEDFLDQRLGSFEILLDKLQKTVHAGRSRLSIGAHRGDEVVEEEDPTKGFFDQDR